MKIFFFTCGCRAISFRVVAALCVAVLCVAVLCVAVLCVAVLCVAVLCGVLRVVSVRLIYICGCVAWICWLHPSAPVCISTWGGALISCLRVCKTNSLIPNPESLPSTRKKPTHNQKIQSPIPNPYSPNP